MIKYIVAKTQTPIQGNTFCELLEEYRKETHDKRTYVDFLEEYPENASLITEQNQDFKTPEEFESFVIIKIVESLEIIKLR